VSDLSTAPGRDLTLALLQQPLVWHEREANLAHFEALLEALDAVDLVVLPEMFTTGFTMASAEQAEADGATLRWLQQQAARHRCALAGSVAVRADDGRCYNRFYLVSATAAVQQYDKRHLFAMAGEHESYTAGNQRLTVELSGWRISPQICYDLRFPVWSRNQAANPYDLLLYVANWPDQRRLHWRSLLQARAIENQCWCVGVNRVGTDGNGVNYAGDSLIIDPLGNIVADAAAQTTVLRHTLCADTLQQVRSQLPFLRDADTFQLS